jgi:DNA-binding GntR family transcriptional regulator
VEQEHHQILDAIREGNEKLAAELSEKHIRNQMVSIVEALDHKKL